ncbi:MAG: tetratricopeptide repeat protein [Candidatus Omnitrophota bacterium]
MKKVITYLLFVILFGVFIFLSWSKLGAYFCNQGNYYFEQQFYKKAAVSYENSIRVNPRAWKAYLGLAEVYLESKDYQRSAQEYKKVLKINPSCSRAYASLSYIYDLQGNYEEALQVLARGQQENPADERIKQSLESCCSSYLANTLNKSTELFLAQKAKAAISRLENVLTQCPGNAFAYYTLGYYYFSSQDYANAKINLHKCITRNSDFHYAYKLFSDIYLKEGNVDQAVFYAQKVVAHDNQGASGYHELGLLLMRLERYAEALLYLKKAVSLAPDKIEYAYSLASVYRDAKMFDQAIAEYRRVSELKDDYPNLHNDLADIYTVLNMPNQALVEYQKEVQYGQEKIKVDSNDPIGLNNYAYALNGAGKSLQAQVVAEKLISAYPRYRQAYLTMSKIYGKMKKPDLALASLEKAKQLSSGESFIDDEIFKLKHVSRH